MGIKLKILSWWNPEWFQKKGLDELANHTISGLDILLDESKNNDPKKNNGPGHIHPPNIVLTGNIDDRRIFMAKIHNDMVKKLIKALGRDEAIELGHEAMFNEGLLLGRKFKEILGVGNNLEDLITAAGILYKVLGIEFRVKESQNDILMVVNRCTLSNYYTSDTCRVLSGADEGVVQGLNPQMKMNFTERITEGSSCCLASIKLKEDDLK